METLAIVAVCAALGGSAWVHFATLRQMERTDTAPAPVYDDRALLVALDQLRSDVDQLADSVAGQTMAIAEGIERVDRSERRVKAVVQRAQARLAASGLEDDSVEAEAEGLRIIDGGNSGQREVLPVPESVASSTERDTGGLSAFPGSFTDDDHRQLREGA